MEENSISLFENIETPSPDSLFVIHNETATEMSVSQIFDASRFNSLKAVSYVSSPKFFAETVKNFESVIFILGIDNVDNLSKFTNGVNQLFDGTDRVKFFNALSADAKDRIVSNKIQIRYGKPGIMIHDKIYLLANNTTGDFRVVIGSANFTTAAFDSNNFHFENVRIDDSKNLYDIYSARFEYLLEQTNDYIPENCRRAHKINNIITITPDTKIDMLFDSIKNHNFAIKLSQEQRDASIQYISQLELEKSEAETNKKIVELIIEKKPNGGIFKLKPLDFIMSRKNDLRDIIHKTVKRKGNNADFRNVLLSNDNYNIYKKISANSNEAEIFSKPAEAGKIKSILEKINSFTSAYLKFASTPNPVIPSKIYELILYAFTAPFIWKIRHKSSIDYDKSSVADIPMFCILGGTSSSGKTTALTFAATLLGQHGRQLYDYSRELDTAGTVHSLIIENNLMPVFADEISMNFFKRSNSSRKGEEMIKSLANEVSDEPRGTLIGTTNLSEFSSSGQVIRRIYYLEVSSMFDARRKGESKEYLRRINDGLDDTLFSDFTSRFASAIRDNADIVDIDDFLKFTRKIFVDYHSETGVEIPSYFPRKIFRDYENRKVETWRTLFDSNRHCFIDKGSIIQVNIDEIFKHSANAKTQKDRLVNFIDESCVASDWSIGANWLLNKAEFYRFIGYTPSLVENVKNSIRKIIN